MLETKVVLKHIWRLKDKDRQAILDFFKNMSNDIDIQDIFIEETSGCR